MERVARGQLHHGSPLGARIFQICGYTYRSTLMRPAWVRARVQLAIQVLTNSLPLHSRQ